MKLSLLKTPFLLLIFTVLLAGCAAPNVVSNVTIFHNLTGSETDKTYMIEATTEQSNNLEFSSYVMLLNQQLQRLGYNMVTKNPSLKVTLQYGTTPTLASTLVAAPAFGAYGFRHGGYWGSSWQTAVDTVFMHHMEVSIIRVSDNKDINSVRSRLVSASPELSQSMDYLIESAFKGYPGKNGTTETIALPYHQ